MGGGASQGLAGAPAFCRGRAGPPIRPECGPPGRGPCARGACSAWPAWLATPPWLRWRPPFVACLGLVRAGRLEPRARRATGRRPAGGVSARPRPVAPPQSDRPGRDRDQHVISPGAPSTSGTRRAPREVAPVMPATPSPMPRSSATSSAAEERSAKASGGSRRARSSPCGASRAGHGPPRRQAGQHVAPHLSRGVAPQLDLPGHALWVFMGLALLGLGLCFPRRLELVVPYAAVVYYLTAALVFYSEIRQRQFLCPSWPSSQGCSLCAPWDRARRPAMSERPLTVAPRVLWAGLSSWRPARASGCPGRGGSWATFHGEPPSVLSWAFLGLGYSRAFVLGALGLVLRRVPPARNGRASGLAGGVGLGGHPASPDAGVPALAALDRVQVGLAALTLTVCSPCSTPTATVAARDFLPSRRSGSGLSACPSPSLWPVGPRSARPWSGPPFRAFWLCSGFRCSSCFSWFGSCALPSRRAATAAGGPHARRRVGRRGERRSSAPRTCEACAATRPGRARPRSAGSEAEHRSHRARLAPRAVALGLWLRAADESRVGRFRGAGRALCPVHDAGRLVPSFPRRALHRSSLSRHIPRDPRTTRRCPRLRSRSPRSWPSTATPPRVSRRTSSCSAAGTASSRASATSTGAPRRVTGASRKRRSWSGSGVGPPSGQWPSLWRRASLPSSTRRRSRPGRSRGSRSGVRAASPISSS